MNLAVALTDVNGQILGECQNPQPIWLLARQSPEFDTTGCPFCIMQSIPCDIAKESLRTGRVCETKDAAGLAHIAVPLFLDRECLGALVAGQVFTDYPQPLLLERVATKLRLPVQQLWRAANKRPPIRHATLQADGQLLEVLGQAVVGKTHADILSRKLRSALAEKTVLLQEVHHRVKNNLAVVSALLSLQADAVDNEETASHLRESQMRIASMASIHEHLYGSKNLKQIRFDHYADELASNLCSLYAAHNVRIEMRIDEIELGIDKSVPCGLILNELLINVFKHAFPNGRPGVITISLVAEHPGIFRLSVHDDGIGIPESFEIGYSKSLGLRIVQILTEQMAGTFEVYRGSGTTFEVVFPAEDSRKVRV